MNREQSYGTGVLFVLVATICWSFSGIFVRNLPELDGWQINCWRGYWMAVALLVFLTAVYGRETFARFRATPPVAMVSTIILYSLGSTLYVTALSLIGTATVAVIGASSPVFTGLLSPWITGERPGLRSWIAAVMALAGVSIIARDGLAGGQLAGILAAIGIPICFAGQTLALRRYRHVDLVPAICVGGFVTFLCTGLFGFLAGHPGGGFEVSLHDFLLLAAMGPLQLAVPLVFYARGAKSVPAVTLALVSMLDAVFNPLWPWVYLGEIPETTAFIGGGIIIGAVLVSIFGGRWKSRAVP